MRRRRSRKRGPQEHASGHASGYSIDQRRHIVRARLGARRSGIGTLHQKFFHCKRERRGRAVQVVHVTFVSLCGRTTSQPYLDVAPNTDTTCHESCPHLNAKNNVESYDPVTDWLARPGSPLHHQRPTVVGTACQVHGTRMGSGLWWGPLHTYTVYGPVSARIMSGSSFKLSSALASPKPKLEVNCGLARARAVDRLPLGYTANSEDLTAAVNSY
ncbi:hypothetical protein FIBSPDRAFT_961145 [Athelia psychrophila]|uniref:Uncharacterized protein n=1 Tax=Athelia psychrophila TaxID=1759441 RepID=A0A166BJ48_9AGAM|nr:hypothetical protein FIBSPDRAFT_961145 [Fibularhizoctonia sp. CBS 109695]